MEDYLIPFAITIILCFLAFLFRKSKLITVVLLNWMFIICALNTGGMDFKNNYDIFSDSNVSSKVFSDGAFVWAYRGIAYLVIKAGFDFTLFNCIINVFSIILLYLFINKRTENVNAVIGLMYIYPLIDFVIQKRWFPAMVILLYAIWLLSEPASIKNTIKYVLLVFLACGFHSGALLFYIFILFNIISCRPKINSGKLLVTFFLIETALIVLTPSLVPRLLGGIFDTARLQLYFVTFAQNSNLIKLICWTIVHLSFMVLIDIIEERTTSKNIEIAKGLNYYSLLIIPFYSFDPIFIRLYRVFIIIDFVALSDYIRVKEKMKITQLYATIGGIGLSLIYFYIFYCSPLCAGYEEMVVPIFSKNLLF